MCALMSHTILPYVVVDALNGTADLGLKKNCVCPLYSTPFPLRQPSKFFGKGSLPEHFVWALDELFIFEALACVWVGDCVTY